MSMASSLAAAQTRPCEICITDQVLRRTQRIERRDTLLPRYFSWRWTACSRGVPSIKQDVSSIPFRSTPWRPYYIQQVQHVTLQDDRRSVLVKMRSQVRSHDPFQILPGPVPPQAGGLHHQTFPCGHEQRRQPRHVGSRRACRGRRDGLRQRQGGVGTTTTVAQIAVPTTLLSRSAASGWTWTRSPPAIQSVRRGGRTWGGGRPTGRSLRPRCLQSSFWKRAVRVPPTAVLTPSSRRSDIL